MSKNTYQINIGSKEKLEDLRFDAKKVVDHNYRKAKVHSKNINQKLSYLNYYENEVNNKDDVLNLFENYYQDDLEKYNSFQTRNDRKKEKWYKKFKKKELLREVCLTFNINWEELDREQGINLYKQVINEYVKINNEVLDTKMVVHDLVIHFDEATPHSHFVFSRYKEKEKILKNGEVVKYREPVGTGIDRDKLEIINHKFGEYMQSLGFEPNKKSEDKRLRMTTGQYREFAKMRDEEVQNVVNNVDNNLKKLVNNLEYALNRSKLGLKERKYLNSIISQICEDNGLEVKLGRFTDKLVVNGKEYTPNYNNINEFTNQIAMIYNNQINICKLNPNIDINATIDNFNEWYDNKIKELKEEQKVIVDNAKHDLEHQEELKDIVDRKIKEKNKELRELDKKIVDRDKELNKDYHEVLEDIKEEYLQELGVDIDDLEKTKQENESLKNENNTLMNKINTLEEDNYNLSNENESLKNENNSLKKELSTCYAFIKDTLTKLKSKVKSFFRINKDNDLDKEEVYQEELEKSKYELEEIQENYLDMVGSDDIENRYIELEEYASFFKMIDNDLDNEIDYTQEEEYEYSSPSMGM